MLVDVPAVWRDLVEHSRELSLSLVPNREVANELLRVASRKSDLEGEAKDGVNAVDKVEGIQNLLLNLVEGTENVRCLR